MENRERFISTLSIFVVYLIVVTACVIIMIYNDAVKTRLFIKKENSSFIVTRVKGISAPESISYRKKDDNWYYIDTKNNVWAIVGNDEDGAIEFMLEIGVDKEYIEANKHTFFNDK